ncbi:major facilitator superfamily domain-containing protein [Coemansia spiralis]|nr:major facilitator superfamily domain-containing protein [Coemansia spiralis]
MAMLQHKQIQPKAQVFHGIGTEPPHKKAICQDKTNKPNSQACGFNIYVLLSAFAASLSSLNFGWCLGEPNIPESIIKDCVEGPEVFVRGFPTCLAMNSTIWGLVVGLVALGALSGSLFAGHAADRFGRKSVLLVNNVFFITGALLLGTATTVAQLAVGRFISGIGCQPRMCSLKVRGFLGVVLQLSVEVGIFFSQIIATLLVDIPNWRILFGLSGVISLVQLALLPFMPESPKFLINQGNTTAATKALQFLRPGHDVSEELQAMVASSISSSHTIPNGTVANSFVQEGEFVDETEVSDKEKIIEISETTNADLAPSNPASSIGIVDIIKGNTPDVIWHPLFCTMFLMGFQQWTGAKGIVFYSTEILIKVFRLNHSQIQHTPNRAQWVTIGLAGMGIVAVFASMNLIDRLGRRQLLLISTGGLTLSCILVVIGSTFNLSVLSVISMFGFKLTYGLGMAPIPWLAASEMLPYYALGTLNGIASALNWSMIFTIGLLFPLLAKALDNFLFLPFAVLNLAAFIVVLLFVPETKSRLISDILFCHGKRVHRVFSLRKGHLSGTEAA